MLLRTTGRCSLRPTCHEIGRATRRDGGRVWAAMASTWRHRSCQAPTASVLDDDAVAAPFMQGLDDPRVGVDKQHVVSGLGEEGSYEGSTDGAGAEMDEKGHGRN